MQPDAPSVWWKRPIVVDAAITVVLAIVLVILVRVASEVGARPVDAVAYSIVLAIAAIQMFRRRFPIQVLVASFVLDFAYHALSYPAIGVAIPLAVPLFTVSLLGDVAAVAVVVSGVLGTLAWMVFGESQPFLDSLGVVVREGAILVAVVMAGFATRGRRLLAIETRERLRLARVEQEARITSERMRIARELHDVIAHTVAVIGIQARVAADTLADQPEQARQALEVISDSTREATSELRATIDVLREGDETPLTPAPGLDQVPALVESVEGGGLPVEVTMSGVERRLPGSVELTAYRVLQESLTNVVRHAGATAASIEIAYLPDGLKVTVTDDGIGGQATPGFGITGMKERVLACGGEFGAGPTSNGGFRVTALIPVPANR